LETGDELMRLFLGAALSAGVLMGAFAFTAHGQQSRSITDGVYSAGQATRGQQIYKAQCAECHGDALQGAAGPPLVGNEFLSNWSARSMAALVDKTQKTMPFTAPGSLSRQQSIELTAHMLQAGKFRAGPTELTDAMLSQIIFPTTQTATTSAAASGGATLPPPEGNLSELMRAIAFPNSNIIFNLQLKDPAKEPKKDLTAAPFDYVQWGSTVYPGWLAVDQAAVALVETAALFLTPGRKCQNGKMAPVDRADWKQYVAALVEVGKLARRTAQERNFDAFADISDKLNTACANCHSAYRDKGGSEGSGVGRCE
jgi:S-disulfanyl-L-cysteine oxidoreductase SoxD